MRYAFFPGCVVPSQMPYLEKLSRDVFAKLGIELSDLDFSCCPYSAVRDKSETEWLTLAARNLAIAQENKLDILTICSGCAQTLSEANHILKSDKSKLVMVNEKLKKIGKSYDSSVNIYHFMQLFDNEKSIVSEKVIKKFTGLKVATHTGCHILRPSKVMEYDIPENPTKFDELVELLGATPIFYRSKTLCCGYTQVTNQKEMATDIMKEKLVEVHDKADMLCVCCPSCLTQYDKNQVLAKAKYKLDYKVPVIHILQLIGLSIGMNEEEVFLKENRSLNEDIKLKLK
ncbi:MAG: CoB--CoM heterodisulfide reductase iron-sulfur subunit B family protein [archaeon]